MRCSVLRVAVGSLLLTPVGCLPPPAYIYLEDPVTADLSGFEEFEYVWGPCLCVSPLIERATIRCEQDGSYAVEIVPVRAEHEEISRRLTDAEVTRMNNLFSEVTFHPAVWAPEIYDVGGDTFRWDGFVLYTYRPGINPLIDRDGTAAILEFLQATYSSPGP